MYMYIFSINQKLKESNYLIALIVLVNLEVAIHPTSTNVNKKNDEDDIVLGHIAIIPFPVFCKCLSVSNRTKTAKTKCKDD